MQCSCANNWRLLLFSPSVTSDSATPWTAARQASLSFPSPGVCPNSCPLSQWCHPTISSSVAFSSSPPPADSLLSEPPRKPHRILVSHKDGKKEWMSLEIIKPSEVSQKDKYYMMSFIYESKIWHKWTHPQEKQTHRHRKQASGCQVGGSWGEWKGNLGLADVSFMYRMDGQQGPTA